MAKTKTVLIILLLITMGAFVLMMYMTEPGMVLTGDSIRYIMGAENLVSGNGYSRLDGYGDPKPIIGFPPAFPASMSVLLLLGVDKLTAPRILNVFFFCGNVFLVGWLLYRSTKRILPAVLGSAAILGFHRTVEFHSYALSEPGFIFLSLLSFTLLAEYQRKGSWWLMAMLCGILGILPLYRYVSLGVLPVVLLLILLFSEKPWKKRLRDIVLIGLSGILPTILWFLRNSRLAGTTTNRSFAYHIIPVEKLVRYLDEVVSWFLPGLLQIEWRPRFSHTAILMAVVTLIYLFFVYRKFMRKGKTSRDKLSYELLSIFSMLFMYSYLATVFLSASFLDASMSASRRYSLPVFVYLVIFTLCVLSEVAWSKGAWKSLGGIGFGLWITIFGFHYQYTIDSLEEIRTYGAYDAWAKGAVEAGEFLDSLGPDTVILTNEIDLVWLLNGRYSFLIPIKLDNYTKEAREDYDHQLEVYRDKMDEGAVLALFDSFYRREFKYASYEELTEGLELVHVSNTVEMFADPDAFQIED